VPVPTRPSTTVALGLVGQDGSTAEDQSPVIISRLSTFSRKLLHRSLCRRDHRAPEVVGISSLPINDTQSATTLDLDAEQIIETSESTLQSALQSSYSLTAASGDRDDVIVSAPVVVSDWSTAVLETSDIPSSLQFASGMTRVRFQLYASNESDTERDEDDVIQRDRPVPLLPKEPHPSKDQAVRRLQSATDICGTFSAATTGRSENYLNVSNHALDINNTRNLTEHNTSPPRSKSSDSGNGCEPLANNDDCEISVAVDLNTRKRARSVETTNSGLPSRVRPSYKKEVSNSNHWSRLRPSSALRKEIKAAKQLGVILGAFTVCFLPYFVCFTVVAFCPSCVSAQLMTCVTWVGYLNSTLNPFLYPLCNANFRRKLRQMLRCADSWTRPSITTSAVNWLPCTC